jgi:hypothetical protein
VFAIADRSGDRYAATFTHSVNGPANSATYRRYVDHLDVTGDAEVQGSLEVNGNITIDGVNLRTSLQAFAVAMGLALG